MKICSLIPGATEVIAALGLEDQLVGISHECDFPPSIRRVPVMIEPLVEAEHTTSSGIDQRVKELIETGQQLYRLKDDAFRHARPDLILAQDLCHVCAVTPDQLTRAVHSLPQRPSLLSLSPTTLSDVITDIERIAEATGRGPEGKVLAETLSHRLDLVRTRTEQLATRPRVVCLEWLSPLYIAGHWVPEMVEIAGGRDVLGSSETPSRQTTWDEVEAAQPDMILVMPCGYSVERTLQELGQAGPVHDVWEQATQRWPHLYVVDAASYFSRPGPRLIDGVELLASILQPETRGLIDQKKAIRLEMNTLSSGKVS